MIVLPHCLMVMWYFFAFVAFTTEKNSISVYTDSVLKDARGGGRDMDKTIDDVWAIVPDYFNRKECEGCGCCISICPARAITMIERVYGSERPIVDMSKCIRCTRCMDACEIYKCYHA